MTQRPASLHTLSEPSTHDPAHHQPSLPEPQAALAPARAADVEALSFAPSHSLEAHRPLGGIMRARLALYSALGYERRRAAGQPVTEPEGPDAIRD